MSLLDGKCDYQWCEDWFAGESVDIFYRNIILASVQICEHHRDLVQENVISGELRMRWQLKEPMFVVWVGPEMLDDGGLSSRR